MRRVFIDPLVVFAVVPLFRTEALQPTILVLIFLYAHRAEESISGMIREQTSLLTDRQTNVAFDRLAEVFKECVRVQAPTRTPDIDTRNRLPFIKGYESELDILRVDQCMAEQHYRGSYIPYVIAP